MNLSTDRLAKRLESELGSAAVGGEIEPLSAHRVDGKTPTLVCTPASPEQVGAALRICNEAAAAVVPWGGGTAIGIGNPPSAYDVALVLTQLNKLIEHDCANLTATVQAGTSLLTLQTLLAPHNQHVAFDVPFPERSTVGGIVAANLNGPRRSFSGNVRDLVIGLKAVLPTGEQIKAGGKVVKNVAGYDMCKLFIGSLGTLGVITELTLKMTALPEERTMVRLEGTYGTVLQTLGALERSPLLPAAVLISNTLGSDASKERWRLVMLCEGFAEAVARQLRDIRKLAMDRALSIEIVEGIAREQYWEQIRDFPLRSDGVIYRLTVPRAAVNVVLETIHIQSSGHPAPATLSDVGAGVIWISVCETAAAKDEFATLIALARQHRGHAVIFAASAEVKAAVGDVWGAPPASSELMREIKRRFDPNQILNHGRFVARL